MGFYRKWGELAITGFVSVDMSAISIASYSFSSLSRLNDIRHNKNESFWLGKLDHKDWLAPNEMLKIFSNIRDPDLIMDSFKKASSRMDYKPREALYSVLIDKLAYARHFSAIDEVLDRAKIDKCRLSDEFFYKVIKIYGHAANHLERAIDTLLRMPEFHCWPTVKTFNCVLNMLVCGKHFEVIHEVYLSAPKLGIRVDTCCFNILIKGLCQWDKLDSAFSLLHEMPKQGCRPNATTYSTLMHSLCKHGRVNEAIELCEEMEKGGCYPDTVTFNVLVSGLCRQGRVAEGLELLTKMKLKGCYPDSGTYQALLYGLLQTNNIVEAKDFLFVMISEGKNPSFLSYKLIIHGLCHERMSSDVDVVLNQMVRQGFVPPMGTWKRILGCMLWKMDCHDSLYLHINSSKSYNGSE